MRVLKYLNQMRKHSSVEVYRIWAMDFLYSLIPWLTPLFIGLAIDGLTRGNNLWFIIFIVVLFAEKIFGFFYRRWDTRVYEKITINFKEKYFEKAIKQNIETSELDVNSELLDEFSEFLRMLVIKSMKIVGILIPLIYLFIEADAFIMVAAIVIVIIVILLQRPFQKSMQQDITQTRNEYERRRDIIGTRDILHYRGFLNRVMDLTVSNSDKDAYIFIISSLFKLGLLAFSVWYVVSQKTATVGVTFATITYIMEFCEATDEVPEMYADFLSLGDAVERIDI